MEYDVSRVFTAKDAHKLKVGSKVICADNLHALKFCVEEEIYMTTIKEVMPEDCMLRFRTKEGEEYALAYLIELPEEKKLKWSDLKMGDIVSNQTETRMVIGINTSGLVNIDDGCISHVNLGGTWADDEDLAEWEKVEK